VSRPPQIDNYRIVAPAGSGSMGEVWQAEHRRTAVPVAIKQVLADGRRRSTAHQLVEIRATAALDHPNVVRVVDVGTLPDGDHWMALEWCGGGTLKQVDSWDVLHRAIGDVLAALAHAHAHYVLHRDVKPGNILRDAVGNWRLADFGVARVGGEPVGGVVGSPHYIAPEVVAGQVAHLGPAVDLYSLGCTVWECVCGRPPFSARDLPGLLEKHVQQTLPDFHPRFDVPPHLENWVRLLLQKAPDDRPSSAAKALALLNTTPAQPRQAGRGRDRRLRDAGIALIRYREPVFVGRRPALAVLEQQFHNARRTRTSNLVVLTGPKGVGRSRLANHFAQRQYEEGHATWGRAWPDGSTLGAINRLFGGLTPDDVARWSGGRPAVVVLDAHATPSTAHTLGGLIRRCRMPILWIVTSDSLPERLVQALRDDHWIEHPVERMDTASLSRILDDTLSLTPSLHATLRREADGLPGPPLERIETWAHQGRLKATEAGFTLRSSEQTGSWAPNLPPEHQGALGLLAIAGGRLPLHAWEAACRVVWAEEPWGTLLDNPILQIDRGFASLTPTARPHWEELGRMDPNVAVAARTLLESLSDGDDRRGLLLAGIGAHREASYALHASARRHRRLGDRGWALVLAEQGLQTAEASQESNLIWLARDLLLQLWVDTWQVRKAREAITSWSTQLAAAAPECHASHYVRRATVHRYGGDHSAAFAELDQAESLLAHDGVANRAWLLFECASQRVSMGDGTQAEPLAQQALALATNDELRAYSALTLGRIKAWAGDDNGARHWLERGLRWADAAQRPAVSIQTLNMLGEACSRSGMLERAEQYYVDAMERADRVPHFDSIMLELNQVANHLRRGAFDAAWLRASDLALDPRARRFTIARVGAALMLVAAAAGTGRWDAFPSLADAFLGYLDTYPQLSDPDFRSFALLCKELAREAEPAAQLVAQELVDATTR
jgi:tetratricopeptide (TPR) repeat protein